MAEHPARSKPGLKNSPDRAGASASRPARPKSPEFTFEREDWTLFRSLSTLSQKAGVPVHLLPKLVLKELADNALDAGGMVPPPSALSAALRCVAVPVGSGTAGRIANTTPSRAALSAISSPAPSCPATSPCRSTWWSSARAWAAGIEWKRHDPHTTASEGLSMLLMRAICGRMTENPLTPAVLLVTALLRISPVGATPRVPGRDCSGEGRPRPDGDTIELGHMAIRLSGVAAPEFG